MAFDLAINGNILTLTSSTEGLTTNREYKITLSADISGLYPSGEIESLGSNYEFWFTSTYCPAFTTVGRVKLLAGPEADNLIDDTIYRMIHKNSLDIVDIVNISYSANYPYDYWGCDWQTVPFHMKQYVECKTAYDVLNFSRIAAGGTTSTTGGNQTKTLGDMTIKYGDSGSSSGSNASDPSKLKDIYDCWNQSMRMIRNMSVSVKAIYDSSKGYAHPVRDTAHNRIIRPVMWGNARPRGPWQKDAQWAAHFNPGSLRR